MHRHDSRPTCNNKTSRFRIRAKKKKSPKLLISFVSECKDSLVKEFGNGNQVVQFSKEPNNLYSFKHSGLANTKTVSVQAGKD
ncbi:hypothetical protein MKW98_030793 [Papaver atlanticum]|uniref:Uncharacterized protein n=1 Tax=Papaver atlanticum TaxID=357466 RepID=A0AAD4S0H8_9MAGN|nr:hypothetical protein MKW98_030793 [Papaver atlanticum]